MYAPGSPEEAVLCLQYLEPAWKAHKEVLFGIFDHLMQSGLGSVQTKPS